MGAVKEFFSGKSPCANCPYRKDSPLQLWDIFEFKKLLEQDKELFGGIYLCHKNNGSACKGWLMNQDERRFPNLNLRMKLMKEGIGRDYLDSLKSKFSLFKSIEEMVKANYPNI